MAIISRTSRRQNLRRYLYNVMNLTLESLCMQCVNLITGCRRDPAEMDGSRAQTLFLHIGVADSLSLRRELYSLGSLYEIFVDDAQVATDLLIKTCRTVWYFP